MTNTNEPEADDDADLAVSVDDDQDLGVETPLLSDPARDASTATTTAHKAPATALFSARLRAATAATALCLILTGGAVTAAWLGLRAGIEAAAAGALDGSLSRLAAAAGSSSRTPPPAVRIRVDRLAVDSVRALGVGLEGSVTADIRGEASGLPDLGFGLKIDGPSRWEVWQANSAGEIAATLLLDAPVEYVHGAVTVRQEGLRVNVADGIVDLARPAWKCFSNGTEAPEDAGRSRLRLTSGSAGAGLRIGDWLSYSGLKLERELDLCGTFLTNGFTLESILNGSFKLPGPPFETRLSGAILPASTRSVRVPLAFEPKALPASNDDNTQILAASGVFATISTLSFQASVDGTPFADVHLENPVDITTEVFFGLMPEIGETNLVHAALLVALDDDAPLSLLFKVATTLAGTGDGAEEAADRLNMVRINHVTASFRGGLDSDDETSLLSESSRHTWLDEILGLIDVEIPFKTIWRLLHAAKEDAPAELVSLVRRAAAVAGSFEDDDAAAVADAINALFSGRGVNKA
ncbi:hypothetical protein HK405_009197 [Cladochytrium tenue]|nr:hypothetical protein HK405_009197 [Cladochytrium tenue]